MIVLGENGPEYYLRREKKGGLTEPAVVQKYLSARGYIGWVRENSVEVAKTGRFGGKNRTLVQVFCLLRVGTRKTGP
jgi:hypothetical protein